MDKSYDRPFDESILKESDVVILCPTEEAACILMNILDATGKIFHENEERNITRPPVTHWMDYGSETCYVISSDYENLRYGSRDAVDCRSAFDKYVRCTFNAQVPEFEVADDNDFLSLIQNG